MSEAFETTVAVRYGDVDTYGHVNNAAVVTYLEEARIDYLEAALGEVRGDDAASVRDALTGTDQSGVGLVVASLDVQYRAPIGLDDDVTVAVTVPDLGESSLGVEYEVRADGALAAEAETTLVAYDRAAGEATPLPREWRDAVSTFDGA